MIVIFQQEPINQEPIRNMEKKLTGEDMYPEFYKKLFGTLKPSAQRELANILADLGIPFRSPQGIGFLAARVGDGCSTAIPLADARLRHLMTEEYRNRHGQAPKESQLREAIRAIHARTIKLCKDAFLRIASGEENTICIDPKWNSGYHIEITPYGWNADRNHLDMVLPVTAAPQVEVRPAVDETKDHQSALDELRQLLHLENDTPSWLRIMVWLLAAFRPAKDNKTPRDYPILELSGPPSSGKTSAARILRALIDPNDAPICLTPTNEAQGGRVARDNHVVVIDGTTRLARRPSEVLARLSTGLPAKFHGDMQNVSRPIIITTNEEGAVDRLSNRVLHVQLPELRDPLPQEELMQLFESKRQQIVEAILTTLSTALRRLPEVSRPKNARFPEAIQWALAALPQLDEKKLVCVTKPKTKLEANLYKLVEDNGGEWKGTATDLAAKLQSKLTARALSQKLSEIEAVCVTKSRIGQERTIKLTLEPVETEPEPEILRPAA